MRWPELGALIADLCRVNTEAITQSTYLRLVDRRVLDLLCHVAGASRVAGQLGRLQSWSYLQASGELRSLQSPGEDCKPLRLSASEWQRLYRGEMLHRTIAHYLGEPAFTSEMIEPPTYSAAEAALLLSADAARRWPHRFKSDVDEAIWAALALWRPSLDRLPALNRLLDNAGTDSEPADPVSYVHRDLVALIQQAQPTARFA
jgi:hypothetical protein